MNPTARIFNPIKTIKDKFSKVFFKKKKEEIKSVVPNKPEELKRRSNSFSFNKKYTRVVPNSCKFLFTDGSESVMGYSFGKVLQRRGAGKIIKRINL